MNFENKNLKGFSVMGIAIRTTNKNGQSQKDIGELWGRFMSENMAAKIPKINENLYCIYTDYESDFMGAYTTILGFEVNSLERIPEGLVGKTIPASSYRCYTSIGALPDSVVNTWKHIWESDAKRKYLADFDLYAPNAFTSLNPEVKIYLSV